jgi:hypothetical protein
VCEAEADAGVGLPLFCADDGDDTPCAGLVLAGSAIDMKPGGTADPFAEAVAAAAAGVSAGVGASDEPAAPWGMRLLLPLLLPVASSMPLMSMSTEGEEGSSGVGDETGRPLGEARALMVEGSGGAKCDAADAVPVAIVAPTGARIA